MFGGAKLLGESFERLRQPAVVGEILAVAALDPCLSKPFLTQSLFLVVVTPDSETGENEKANKGWKTEEEDGLRTE